jgi:hypothetical protein
VTDFEHDLTTILRQSSPGRAICRDDITNDGGKIVNNLHCRPHAKPDSGKAINNSQAKLPFRAPRQRGYPAGGEAYDGTGVGEKQTPSAAATGSEGRATPCSSKYFAVHALPQTVRGGDCPDVNRLAVPTVRLPVLQSGGASYTGSPKGWGGC